MATLNFQKIFVEPKEELSFVLERILNAAKDVVVLSIPQNSVLFASVLTLKILFRQVLKKKTVIILTEDKYGSNIAQKNGFVVVNKFSQVTTDLIEIAKSKQDAAVIKLNQKKSELLGLDSGKEEEEIQVIKTENQIEEPDSTPEINIEETELLKMEKTDVPLKEEENEKESRTEIESGSQEFVEVDGLQLFIGKDISDFINEDINDKMSESINNDDMENERKVDTSVFGSNKFAGKDFTKHTKKNAGIGFFSNLFGSNKIANPEDRLEPGEPIKWYKKRGVIISIATLGIFTAIILLFILFWSTVAITLRLKKEDIFATQDLTGVIDLKENDLELERIPVLKIKRENESISGSADATGEGRKGERAKGYIYIFNKSQNPITLQKGTKVKSISSNLEYTLQQNVSIPVSQIDDQTIIAGKVDNVLVEAVSYGEQYNIAADSDTTFTVEGFDGITVLEARQESNFNGGTTEEFATPSEEDVKKLKQALVEKLQEEAYEKLRNNVPNGSRLIEDSLEFIEKEVKAVPEIGKESEDKKFDLSIVAEVRAIVVAETDLEEFIQFAISDNDSEDTGETVKLEDVENIAIENYERSGDSISFTINAEGKATNQISEGQIKDLIRGKSLSSVNSLLNSVESIQDFSIRYYPLIIPEFLRVIPSSDTRIEVRFQ